MNTIDGGRRSDSPRYWLAPEPTPKQLHVPQTQTFTQGSPPSYHMERKQHCVNAVIVTGVKRHKLKILTGISVSVSAREPYPDAMLRTH
jgi:hypothetical protein